MIADLIAIGDQVGFFDFSSRPMPATCGLDIEVPDSALYRLPLLVTGDTAAITSTPGAVMSGLSRSDEPDRLGPADENAAISGARAWMATAAAIDAVGLAVPAMYALIAVPSGVPTCTVGTKWKSALSELVVGLYSTMPTPPAFLTARLLAIRSLTPRRHSTILPVTLAGSSVFSKQSSTWVG